MREQNPIEYRILFLSIVMFKAQRQFDDQSAKMLDRVADRVDGKPYQESDLILVPA
jgi:hypothetical protein